MEAKHTPGPWKKFGDFVGPSTFEPVCRIVRTNVNTASQANENQSLIEAAPDLLKSLQELVAMIHRQSDFNDDGDGMAIERAEAAIALSAGTIHYLKNGVR